MTLAGREDVFALIDGQRERWRVGDIAELKRPDAEWIKKNSGRPRFATSLGIMLSMHG
jgi:hypothetical protein